MLVQCAGKCAKCAALRSGNKTNPIRRMAYSHQLHLASFAPRCSLLAGVFESQLLFGSASRQFLPASKTETSASFLWFAAIQCIKRIEDLAGLAPQGSFIPAEPIERAAGQIGKTQEASREVDGGIDGFP